jgi:ABC-type transport system substrate-binding protein
MRIGFIGLGRMGANMVRRLIRDDHEIVVYNRTPEKTTEIATEGAIPSYSIEELVFSPDGQQWTFKMRKGMKFSDGEPLTTEDVRFYIEDIWFNTDLNASPMWQIRFDGKANETAAKLEVIDEVRQKDGTWKEFGRFIVLKG